MKFGTVERNKKKKEKEKRLYKNIHVSSQTTERLISRSPHKFSCIITRPSITQHSNTSLYFAKYPQLLSNLTSNKASLGKLV